MVLFTLCSNRVTRAAHVTRLARLSGFLTLLFLLFSGTWAGSVRGQQRPASANGATARTGALPAVVPASTSSRHATVTTRLLTNANRTYGYEVLVNGQVLVSQPSIPGRPGNEGFHTAAEAQRVAGLVARKVRAGQMPPTVTAAELKRLHAGQ
ncbi:DUF4907 domain-containing protein [Hymenobacter negativus]|uniref:DUF4907 domain-containing protein n=1 Tax=Hymenobacter negativus TaxID=2795026 RepID=A0ABS3Q987_9BACT|nr:DUF4907 domain-containing protein [Hymenobacter negativus]MBO2007717.1 DUF4907 domain-containing protein [Hymenobacter negativus]